MSNCNPYRCKRDELDRMIAQKNKELADKRQRIEELEKALDERNAELLKLRASKESST